MSLSETTPASEAALSGEPTAALVAELRRRSDADPAAFPDDALQALEQLVIAVHGAKYDAGLPLGRAEAMQANSPTAVLVTATEMMKSANLEIFELGMWQSWSGTR